MVAYYTPVEDAAPELCPIDSDKAFVGTATSCTHCGEIERDLRKEGCEVPSRVRLREGPIGVRITLGQPTIG